jgi:NAD+ synthase (glutamine-hydrolysing)
MEQILSKLAESPADIVVFPKLSLCSPGCGQLFFSPALLDACRDQLERLRILTRERPSYIIVGLPLFVQGRTVSAAAVLYQGELLGYVPSLDDPEPLSPAPENAGLLPPGTVFGCGDLRFVVLPCDPARAPMHLASVMRTGFDLAVLPAYTPATAGSAKADMDALKALSRATGTAVAVANGGLGDSSCPFLYRGYAAVWECGQTLGFAQADKEPLVLACDLEPGLIQSGKRLPAGGPSDFVREAFGGAGLLRPLCQNPFLPADENERRAFLSELFDLQVRSLVDRLRGSATKRAVVGVSGGADSALALLVAAAAMDRLNLPRQNVLGITMPGFGTADGPYYNALALIEAVGATGRDIPVRAAMLQHFEDIAHPPAKQDRTFQNAQARERAQILLDVADQNDAVVVGTQNLSEYAAGRSAFAAHACHYNVNGCLTADCVRQLLMHIARTGQMGDVAALIQDILAPGAEEAESEAPQEQILSEDGLGELDDFFLYYLFWGRMRPSRVFYYACIAFAGRFGREEIRDRLSLTIRRLAESQPWRGCPPQGAVITRVHLCGGTRSDFPFILDPSALLADIEDGGEEGGSIYESSHYGDRA